MGRTIFPLLPPYGAQDPNHGHIIPLNPDGITPYLGLKARLSQVWLNRWTVLLLLILARVLIAVGGLETDMGSAKREALSACTSVESMGSAMASMPHYSSRGINEVTASTVEAAVRGLKSTLMLMVTGVEEIILFIINVMYQTYLCLITMAVRGTVDVGVGLLKDATGFLNSTVKEVGHDIASAVDTFEDGLNKFLDTVNSVASVSGGSVPDLNISSSIDKLENAQLPSSINDGLDKINSSIPTFSEVQNFTENVLRWPFEEVKKLMNESLGTYEFNRSVLPVPAKEKMHFCDGNDGINSFFDGIGDLATTAKKIFIAVLVILAVLFCVPVAWSEIRRWRTMKDRSQLVRKEAHDPMDVVYIVSRPYTAGAGIKTASWSSNSRRQALVRWAVAYATSTPALFVLCLGIAGLFSCLCQFLLLCAVQKTVPELTSEVGDFADTVVDSLQNTSASWANDANGAISNVNSDINSDVFGWVNTSTTAVNDTLNTFVDKTTGVLNDTFGDTILYEPIMDVYDCLIGLKVAGIQKGLTWVHDHAHIDFPLLPNDTLSRGAQESIDSGGPGDSFLTDAGDETADKITSVVARVVKKIEEGIKTEAIISTVIVLIWVLVALMGILRAAFLFFMRDKNRGEGGGLPSLSPGPNSNPNAGMGPGPDGFFDVPLTAMPNLNVNGGANGAGPGSREVDPVGRDYGAGQPAPRYEASVGAKGASAGVAVVDEDVYPDEKLDKSYGLR